MNEIKLPDCVDCPLLDKTIDNGCPDHSHEPAMPGRTCMVFPQGAHLFEEGAPIKGIHCLHSGQVALAKKQSEEEMWIVAVATPGEVLGMPDILSEKTHRSGALALQDSSACFIPKEEALELFKKNPPIMLQIMRRIIDRIRWMEEHIEKEEPRNGLPKG